MLQIVKSGLLIFDIVLRQFTIVFQFFTTYQRIIIVLLTIVLAIPCSVKRELKQQFYAEANQNKNSNSVKISCTSFCSLALSSNKKYKQYQSKEHFPDSHSTPATIKIVQINLPVRDDYDFFKEQVPTYISNQQFLI